MKRTFYISVLVFYLCIEAHTISLNAQTKTYRNPVAEINLPDPTVIRTQGGEFYLYATGHINPIYRSTDLVNWEKVGEAFTEDTRPNWEPKGGLWAPDINYINGQYVMYYSMSVWGGEMTCGIGVATAKTPTGPFTDHGALFRSNTIGVQNSIDQFYIEDNGKKYLFWGSFHGIYGIELSDDGLSIREGAEKTQIAGTLTEGTYIHKRGKYYYLFGSAGSCCEGEKSTYRVVVARSENLFGPYVNKKGETAMENNFETVIHGNDTFVGTGHNAEFVTDNAGQDWILYHSYLKDKPKKGRVLMLDHIQWANDWPFVAGDVPAAEAEAPVFNAKTTSGNPILAGWYADPEGIIYDEKYWIFPTYSDKYENQVFFDCFSSEDLITWKKHHAILDTTEIKWAKRAMWAPSVIRKDGKYYIFFGANDVHEGEIGGIGVAVSDRPEGPYKDLLGKPLIGEIVNGAQPIDQFVFEDNGEYYLYYGGWRHCNVVRLKDDFTGLKPFDDGTMYKEITPENYVEGPFMFRKGGKYYFMWSEGGWTGPNYAVAYAISDSPFGPFKREAKILQQDSTVANGAGHHSVIHPDGSDDYYIIYHRRPFNVKTRDYRETCIDKLVFDADGHILPVKMTFKGVPARKIKK